MSLETILNEISVYVPAHKLVASAYILGIFAIFYMLNSLMFYSAVSKLPNYFADILKLLKRVISVIIVVIALITMLEQWGVDVKALIAGFGITGFVVTYMLKDVVSSTLNGAMIRVYKPFKIGDTIKIDKVEGEVVKIEMQYTTLLSKGCRHIIPNNIALSQIVTVKEKS